MKIIAQEAIRTITVKHEIPVSVNFTDPLFANETETLNLMIGFVDGTLDCTFNDLRWMIHGRLKAKLDSKYKLRIGYYWAAAAYPDRILKNGVYLPATSFDGAPVLKGEKLDAKTTVIRSRLSKILQLAADMHFAIIRNLGIANCEISRFKQQAEKASQSLDQKLFGTAPVPVTLVPLISPD